MSDFFIWNRAGACGDVLMTLNLINGFRKKHPNAQVFYKCHPDISPLIGSTILEMGFDGILDSTKPFIHDGKEFRLIGYPLHEGYPIVPMKKHLINYFADELKIEPDFDSFELAKPAFPIKDDFITIHVKAGWSRYKNWDVIKWEELAFRLKDKIKVLQIGGADDPLIKSAFGRVMSSPGADHPKTLFRMCLSAIANARLHVGPDSWTGHATNIKFDGKRTKGIILWGSTQVLASGYKTNVNISKNLECQPCFVENPEISSTPNGDCRNKINHKCMKDITVDEVYTAVMENL